MDEIEIAKAILTKISVEASNRLREDKQRDLMKEYKSYRERGYSPISSAILAGSSLKFGKSPTDRELRSLEEKFY